MNSSVKNYKQVFSARLQQICKERNIKTKEFFDDLEAQFQKADLPIVSSTIQGWYYGRTFPEAPQLLLLCDFLEVDLDYLLGRINGKTHDENYLMKLTGLSQPSVSTLINKAPIQRTIFSIQNNTPHPENLFIRTLDILLKESQGKNVITTIGEYLHLDNTFTYGDYDAEQQLIHFNERLRPITADIKPPKLSTILLYSLQEEIVQLKDSLYKTQQKKRKYTKSEVKVSSEKNPKTSELAKPQNEKL